MSEEVVSIQEAMEMLKMSDATIRRMIKEKSLDAVLVRNRWRIRKASIMSILHPETLLLPRDDQS